MCLEATSIASGYGQMQILWGVDLHLAEGEAVVLLGANGAGKTTLLRSIMGLLPLRDGEVKYFGKRIDRLRPDERALGGISYMSEMGVFSGLSIEENVRLGGYGMNRSLLRERMDYVWEQFPQLHKRRKEAGGSLSGGQRKLLGVARALVRAPKLIIMDEPSAGLSPLFVNELVDTLRKVHQESGITLLLAEQNVKFLGLADRAYVIEGGRSTFEGTVQEFEQNADLSEAFFGLSNEHGGRQAEAPAPSTVANGS